MIRVLLVDDHEAILFGLTRVLDESEGFSVVGCARDGGEALRLVADLRPDVVMMDLSMGATDGVSTIEGVLAVDPAARVVVLSSHGEPSRVDQALRAGACGFLVKGESAPDLRAAVRLAHAGERTFSRCLLPGLRRLGLV